MMEVVVTTGAVRGSKLQLDCRHQPTNTKLFTGQMPFLSPSQECQSTEGKSTDFTCISLFAFGDLMVG